MAQHASAEKRNRQRVTRTARNRSIKSSLRTEVKKARGVIDTSTEGAALAAKTAESSLARAASKGVIPKKRAARVAGRLAKAAAKATSAAK